TRYFTPTSKKTPKGNKKKLRLDIERIAIVNNHFKLTNHNYTHHNRGVDFSDLDITEISGVFENIRMDSIAQADIHEFTLKEKSGLYIRELTTKASYSNRAMEFQELYLATNNSVVQDYLKFDYADITDFNDFIRKVHINS